ncbi:hypothetical protein PMIT1323_02534 [Prochlorococcus marinus str. MIT 1323]|nr:hypothetical protein PMIT1323_02534 [Prochlorococcus marinus str. MIT 1323]
MGKNTKQHALAFKTLVKSLKLNIYCEANTPQDLFIFDHLPLNAWPKLQELILKRCFFKYKILAGMKCLTDPWNIF